MRISDWSSDVCSSDLPISRRRIAQELAKLGLRDGAVATCAARSTSSTREANRKSQRGGVVKADVRQGSAPVGGGQIGRASGRERVCQYVSISVVAVYLKKNTITT